MEFREVVDAFETLSDETARKAYDRSGKTFSEQAAESRSGGGRPNGNAWQQWNWDWRQEQQHQQYNPKNHHRYLFDFYRRKQILDAQSRIVSVKPTMKHLRTVMFSEWDSDESVGAKHILDRYVLIAFYDSSSDVCSNRLFNQILYPWPFAGYSSEGSKVTGIWWEDLLMTVKMDLASNPRTLYDVMELVDKYGLNMVSAADGGLELRTSSCPSIVLLNRGDSLDKKAKAQVFSNYEGFSDWVLLTSVILIICCSLVYLCLCCLTD